MITLNNDIAIDDLCKRYIEAYNNVSVDIIRQAFINFPNHVVANDKIAFMFVRLSDQFLNLIKGCPLLLMDQACLEECYADCGDNIHLLKAFGDAKGFRPLIKDMVHLENPQSITFYRDDFVRLHTVYKRS